MIRVVQHFNNNRWIFLAKKGSEKFAIKMIYKPNENFSEYKILTSLNPHPHIIKLIDSLEISQFLVVLIFPWISKTSENLPHDPLIIKTCFKQLIEAISHCHENGFLHLDIKPSNILVELDNKEPRLYLCDFGLSVSIREAISRPFLTLAGTFSYCAPEILLEIGGDSAVDIWSAGVVLAEWIFKKKIFHGHTQDKVLASIKYFSYPPLPQNFPDSSLNLLQSILIEDPKKRLTSKEILNHPYLNKEF